MKVKPQSKIALLLGTYTLITFALASFFYFTSGWGIFLLALLFFPIPLGAGIIIFLNERLIRYCLPPMNWMKEVGAFVMPLVLLFLSLVLSSEAYQLTRASLNSQSVELVQALENYKNDHNSYPNSLAELQPQYLQKLPRFRFLSEQKLMYRQVGKGYEMTLYSAYQSSYCFKSDQSESDILKHREVRKWIDCFSYLDKWPS